MKLDTFTAAYIECALWTFEDNQFSLSDLAPETREKMLDDCANFQAIADRWHATTSRAGHDFWLTRNGHGAGFWDGDWPEHGDKLTAWAKTFGECDLYVGDDGKVYL